MGKILENFIVHNERKAGRLNTPAPKIESMKTDYNRKIKHKENYFEYEEEEE